MLFDLNEQQFMIKFKRAAVFTFAELWQYKSDLGEYDCLNIVGVSECSPKDVFVKSKGRKIALAKLFKVMNEHSYYDKHELHNSKEDRTRIWEIYFKEHKK